MHPQRFSRLRRSAAHAALAGLTLFAVAPVLIGAAPAQARVTTPAARLDLRSRTFTWGELSAGDCHQTAGTMVFFSDGTGRWSATTWTDHTHSGDIWHSSFNVLTSAGAGLFNVGEFNSPRMDDGNPSPRYGWSDPFTFNPDLFDAIGQVIQHSSC